MASAAVVFCLLLAVVAVASRKRASSGTDGKIVGGKQTRIGDVPYQVSLQVKDKHYCGGAIIGKKHVLTAAHCVQGRSLNDYSVRVGSTHHSEGGQIIKVKTIMGHPSYNASTGDSDIAFVELKDPITDENAVPIPLAESEPKAGDEVLLSGWGAIRDKGPLMNILQSVTVKVIDRQDCADLYKDVGTVTENMFCAGYLSGGKDSCQGDSGGPAALNRKLVGIISWGNGCARPGQPGVLTSVAKFEPWIRGNMGSIN